MTLRKTDKRVSRLLSEHILAACQSVLSYTSHVCVEGLLAITLDDSQFCLVHMNDTLQKEMVYSKKPNPSKRPSLVLSHEGQRKKVKMRKGECDSDDFDTDDEVHEKDLTDQLSENEEVVLPPSEELGSEDWDQSLVAGDLLNTETVNTQSDITLTHRSGIKYRASASASPETKMKNTNQSGFLKVQSSETVDPSTMSNYSNVTINSAHSEAVVPPSVNAQVASPNGNAQAEPVVSPNTVAESMVPPSVSAQAESVVPPSVSAQSESVVPPSVMYIKSEPADFGYSNCSNSHALPRISSVMSFSGQQLSSASTESPVSTNLTHLQHLSEQLGISPSRRQSRSLQQVSSKDLWSGDLLSGIIQNFTFSIMAIALF